MGERIWKFKGKIENHIHQEKYLFTDFKELFEDFFGDGMGPAVAAKYYKEVLQMKSDFQLSDPTNSRINVFRRTIEYWLPMSLEDH
ncbi:hypothetical protein HNY73_001547 [Argiope bruennichi]|uniref:Uncharacterized protein n=1 Tax=Argiope bruennichi TaxID=94029 RepID=A0A8T0G2U6_ARGBR|nr:hypothetical protein HNY73_001547 [Argiope bruennichi]